MEILFKKSAKQKAGSEKMEVGRKSIIYYLFSIFFPSKSIIYSLFSIFFTLTSFAQEKVQDSTKVNQLEEVTIAAVRAKGKDPITFSNLSKKKLRLATWGKIFLFYSIICRRLLLLPMPETEWVIRI